MNNTQFYFAIGVPTFTVIMGILINLWSNNRLSARIDRLEDRLNTIHDLLIGKVIEHEGRISKLEHR